MSGPNPADVVDAVADRLETTAAPDWVRIADLRVWAFRLRMKAES